MRTALLVLCALSAFAAPARAPRLPGLQRALIDVASERPRVALDALEPLLVEHPDHARLRAVAGLAYAQLGDGPRALALLEGADPTALPQLQAVLIGDALRLSGQPVAAQAARWAAITGHIDDRRLSWMAARGAIDCLEAEDLACAIDFVRLGQSVFPDSGALLGLEAEVLIREGALDEAEACVRLAERDRRRSGHRAVAQVELLLAQGAVLEAATLADVVNKEVVADPRLAAVRARAWRAAGDPARALSVVRHLSWTRAGAVVHPALRLEEVLALVALGERDEAEARAADLMAELPAHAAAAAAAAAIGAPWGPAAGQGAPPGGAAGR
ncbi:MAG: hypothetical protein JNM72_26065 [Deltaproteobacteria bacterium]|nr:hypothetical protein [Deltaproteobacteria bacterium]